MKWSSRASILILLLACAITIGCRGRKKDKFDLPGQTELVIKKFEIQGVKSVSEAELKAGLATRRANWARKWGKKQFFNYVHWQQDLERIRTFYYARGYFDAKVVSENISEDPSKKEVRISITVSEGQPSTISEIDVEGVEEPLRGTVIKGIGIRSGQVFTEQGYIASRQQLKDRLEEAGYAYADVEGRVVVEARQRKVQVVFYVDSGPISKFGDVTVVGMEGVPESAIREAITFKVGDRYSPEKMQETRERIYDLGVFSLVKVSADTDREEEEVPPPAEEESAADEGLGGLGDLLDEAQSDAVARAELDPVVPVTIQVKEAKLWNVRVGAGVAAESARQETHGRLDWSSRNFLGGLRKLEHFNSAGYAWAPSIFRSKDERNQGVIVDTELRFTQPRFLERFTTLESRLRFQREVEQGFNLVSPTAKLGLRRRFFRFMTAEVSYNFALFVLSGIEPALLDPSLRLQPEYILEYLEQRVALDFLNDFLNPTRGWRIELQLQEAAEYIGHLPGVPTGGHFDYVAPTLSFEVYLPAWRHVLALRARAATIYNLGDKQPPIPQRLYAGGADSMRAFGRQRLSLFSVSGDALPIGGFTRVEGVVEPRFRVVRQFGGLGDFWVAPFADAATVLPGALFVKTTEDGAPPESWGSVFDSLLYGVGVGAWWVTPVGPVRLDFAYRLSDIIDDPRFRRCAIEPNIAGTCNGEFVAEQVDPVRAEVKRPYNFILGIGHSF